MRTVHSHQCKCNDCEQMIGSIRPNRPTHAVLVRKREEMTKWKVNCDLQSTKRRDGLAWHFFTVHWRQMDERASTEKTEEQWKRKSCIREMESGKWKSVPMTRLYSLFRCYCIEFNFTSFLTSLFNEKCRSQNEWFLLGYQSKFLTVILLPRPAYVPSSQANGGKCHFLIQNYRQYNFKPIFA